MSNYEIARRLTDRCEDGCIEAKCVKEAMKDACATVDEIMLALIEFAERFSRPAISGYAVGAVGLGASESVYFGANFEFLNCPLNQTIHAEQAVVINAHRHRERKLVKLAVSAPPCGHCRQFLYELIDGHELEVLVPDSPPRPLHELLPYAFGPADFGLAIRLLAHPAHPLEFFDPDSAEEPAAAAAIKAACISYAPSSHAYGAVALTAQDGRVFTGAYLENVAFNPSVSPAQSAILAAHFAGCAMADLRTATIVQLEDSKIDHTLAARCVLEEHASQVVVNQCLIRNLTPRPQSNSRASEDRDQSLSFYFFDIDDNILRLATPVLIRHTVTGKIVGVETGKFAAIRRELGRPGPWQEYETFDGTYRHFRDLSEEEAATGQPQHLLEDLELALLGPDKSWQAPSWPLFAHACKNQRPVALITARGHNPQTIKAAIRILVERGHLLQEPNYLAIYPVGNPQVQEELQSSLEDEDERKLIRALSDRTSALKRIAIHRAVDSALKTYGDQHLHRFGMSDDDPNNIDLIIKAMCDCKKKYLDQRFFVIDTHENEMAKLEVFPVDYPVTARVEKDEIIG